jgi:hypothetical protein
MELAAQQAADKPLIDKKKQEEVVARISRTVRLIPQELRNALSWAAIMLPTLLQVATRALFVLGAIAMALSVFKPISLQPLMFIGLALWVGAFLCGMWRHFFLQSPIPTRGGEVKFESQPISHVLWFSIATALGGFFIHVLLHNSF